MVVPRKEVVISPLCGILARHRFSNFTCRAVQERSTGRMAMEATAERRWTVLGCDVHASATGYDLENGS